MRIDLAEALFQAALVGGSGGGTVEPLNVTANGTYAEVGKSYSPVVVNVGGTVSEPWKQINFIDFDGSVVYSFTKADFLASSGLPANPSHDGLIAEGWNWTRQEILDQLTAMPNAEIVIGQCYHTESGDTEIDISLPEGWLSPTFAFKHTGDVTVDWGDGTSTVYEGTVTRDGKMHTYASAGDYTISIHAEGTSTYAFNGSTSPTPMLYDGRGTGFASRYGQFVNAIRCAANTHFNGVEIAGLTHLINLKYVTFPLYVFSFGNNAVQYCTSLKSITFPLGTNGSIGGQNVVSYCYDLESVSIPGRVTPFRYNWNMSSAFSSCYSLAHITLVCNGATSIQSSNFSSCPSIEKYYIPNTVTSLSNTAFSSSSSIKEIHVYTASPPTLASSTFGNATVMGGTTIYVPAANLTDYQTASNWSTYSSLMVGE